MPVYSSHITGDETSFRLYARNYRELKRLLDKTEEIPAALTITNKEDVGEEIARLLHNYVSSAMSLVTHTRNLNKSLYENTNPEAFKQIQEEIDKRFVNNETHQIIQGLKDYTQHRQLPIVGRAISFNAMNSEPTLEAAYYLSTESLLAWDGWKPLAKQKLYRLKNLSPQDRLTEHQMKDIPINPLITDHYTNEAAFYEWLGNKRREWLRKTDIIKKKPGSRGQA